MSEVRASRRIGFATGVSTSWGLLGMAHEILKRVGYTDADLDALEKAEVVQCVA